MRQHKTQAKRVIMLGIAKTIKEWKNNKINQKNRVDKQEPLMIKRGNGEEVKNERKIGYVSWVTFTWIIGIILIIIGFVFNQITIVNAKSEDARIAYTAVKEDIRELKTNISWIVDTLKQNKR